MRVMFLDESGDHNLTKIDPQYPMFVLGGVIVDADYAEGEMQERVNQFKRDLFGHDKIILHTADIVRARNGFEELKDDNFRKKFHSELNDLMKSLEYMVVACAIDKNKLLKKHVFVATDPYRFSLEIVLERFCFEIRGGRAAGKVIAEARNPKIDKELENCWQDIKMRGTYYLRPQHVKFRISTFEIRTKRENSAGLQLADLVVSPIGRHVLGRSTKEDFRIIEKKFRCDANGNYHGRGLIILPRTVRK